MSLLAPAWLLLCAFGGVILLLHLKRRRTVAIPSIQLWRQLESGRLSKVSGFLDQIPAAA